MARVVTEEQTLSGQLRSLHKETNALRYLVVVEAAIAGGCLIAGIMIRLRGGGNLPLVFGAVLGFLALSHLSKQKQNQRQHKQVAAGLRGEARIGRILEEELGAGYYILNDTTVDSGRKQAQIDHLVLGPKGVFVLETKNWAGHLTGSADGYKWTQLRRAGDKPIQLNNPIRQVKRQSDFVRQFLASKGHAQARIYPAVVLMHRRATWEVESQEVPILAPADIPEFVFAIPPEPQVPEATVLEWVRLFAGEEAVP